MTKIILKSDVFINETQDSQVLSGYVNIQSTGTINIDAIKGYIFFETRGKTATHRKEILSFKVTGSKVISKGELHKIPFSFKLPSKRRDSYKGKNVSFSYNCEIKITVNENDIEKLERSLFAKIASFVKSDKSIKCSTYFEVKNAINEYEVKERKSEFELQYNLIISLYIGVIIGGIYIWLIPEFNEFYNFMGLFVLFFILIVVSSTTKHIGRMLGIVTMKTLKDENAFLCKIGKKKNFDLSNPSIYYQIIEKVVDNRGTSSATYESVIYTSKTKKLSNFKGSADLKFLYPETNGLYSLEYEGASIIWKMYLQGTTYLGLLKYKTEFTVKRKQKPFANDEYES